MPKESIPLEDYNDLMDLYFVAGEPVDTTWYIKEGDENRWAYNGLRGAFLIQRGYTPAKFYALEDRVRADLGEVTVLGSQLADATPDDFKS